MLIWHLNGYWLLYKRVETQRFHWPDWFADNETIELDQAQLNYLLDGSMPHQASILSCRIYV